MNLLFNSSMPRSGSELLQVLLHQNPTIYGSSTSPLLEYQFAARANTELPEVLSQDSQLMQTAFLNMCGGMAESYYEAITERPNVVDKNRGWMHYFEWVSQWYDQPKMVCMVRDLRSIIASMEKVYRANRHRPIGPDNPAELQAMTVMARAQYWLNVQPVGLALQRLHDCFQRTIDDKILFIRFEDLCKNPQTELNRWYEFAGLPSHPHAFDDIQKTVVENDSHFGPYGNHKIKKTIEKPQLWSEVLPQEVGDMIYQSSPWYFDQFGYKRAS